MSLRDNTPSDDRKLALFHIAIDELQEHSAEEVIEIIDELFGPLSEDERSRIRELAPNPKESAT